VKREKLLEGRAHPGIVFGDKNKRSGHRLCSLFC
jgi:hypothetical protein